MNIYHNYIEEWEVKPEFKKEFISIFDGWLGKENYHKLDEVTESEWSRFNHFIRLLSENFELFLINFEVQSATKVDDINNVLTTYEEDKDKDASHFTNLIIPQLKCVLSEEWDYTYILWYKDKITVDALKSLISKARLYHFSDENE